MAGISVKSREISVETAKLIYHGSYIDNDLMLFHDIADLPFPKDPCRMQSCLLALCLQGKAQYSIDTVLHTVQPGDLLILGVGQVTDDFMISRDCNGVGIMVSRDFYSEIVENVHELSALFLFSRNHPVCHLTQQEIDTFMGYFHMLKQKVDDTSHHFRRNTVRSLMTTMMYDLSNIIYRMQTISDLRETRAEQIFTSFIRLVEENFRNERRVGWYSKQLGISSKYLLETIKNVSRRTPNEWIDDYIILEIRVLLKNSTKPIKQIAEELNFPNQSFLGKFFKEHVGMNPTEYRRK